MSPADSIERLRERKKELQRLRQRKADAGENTIFVDRLISAADLRINELARESLHLNHA